MEEEKKEVEQQEESSTTPSTESNEFDEIFKALEDGESTEGESKETLEEGESEKDYYKKVGYQTFKTEEEYEAWAQRNHGEVTRLTGEMKKLQEQLASKATTPEVKKETEQDIDALRMRIKAIDFFEDNPEATNYREEMAAFLRAGKAVDDKGRPSLEKAYKMALRAEGKEEKVEDIKKVMQAGGGDSGRTASPHYETKSDVEELDDFADAALAGRFN